MHDRQLAAMPVDALVSFGLSGEAFGCGGETSEGGGDTALAPSGAVPHPLTLPNARLWLHVEALWAGFGDGRRFVLEYLRGPGQGLARREERVAAPADQDIGGPDGVDHARVPERFADLARRSRDDEVAAGPFEEFEQLAYGDKAAGVQRPGRAHLKDHDPYRALVADPADLGKERIAGTERSLPLHMQHRDGGF